MPTSQMLGLKFIGFAQADGNISKADLSSLLSASSKIVCISSGAASGDTADWELYVTDKDAGDYAMARGGTSTDAFVVFRWPIELDPTVYDYAGGVGGEDEVTNMQIDVTFTGAGNTGGVVIWYTDD